MIFFITYLLVIGGIISALWFESRRVKPWALETPYERDIQTQTDLLRQDQRLIFERQAGLRADMDVMLDQIADVFELLNRFGNEAHEERVAPVNSPASARESPILLQRQPIVEEAREAPCGIESILQLHDVSDRIDIPEEVRVRVMNLALEAIENCGTIINPDEKEQVARHLVREWAKRVFRLEISKAGLMQEDPRGYSGVVKG